MGHCMDMQYNVATIYLTLLWTPIYGEFDDHIANPKPICQINLSCQSFSILISPKTLAVHAASHRPCNFTAFCRSQARRTITAFSSSPHLLRAIHSLLTASLSDLLRATVVRRPPAVVRRPPPAVLCSCEKFIYLLKLHLVSSPRKLCDTGDFELSPNMKIKVDYEYKYVDDPGRVTTRTMDQRVIPISFAELDVVKFKPENGLKLLGFMEASNVMSWILSISKYFLLRRMWEFQFPSLSNLPSTMQPTEQQQEVADKLVQMLDLAPPDREEA
ncbi:ATP-dependent DNA helicase 2 subunit ku80 [Striga asiatica]|uniref:ATP-dependent DNA helicase 2 subunit ku80 n=1 Tax=Striga asiatica TaxID=4170 RepID=A0A5A7Q746_STRAF|nr:ATP-dependent DNA helicase 2 subunit ku80 [Striga asiatica]